jgi:hypothetical protein
VNQKIDTSPLVLPTGRRGNGVSQLAAVDQMRDLLAALGWVEFWEHHRDCKPLSAEGCTCHYTDVLLAVRAIRGNVR